MRELTIEYRPVDQIRRSPSNARLHSPKQVGQIAKSIETAGFANPLLIDENGEIIAGHGRLLAAQKLQMANVPVIVLTGLSEAQKRYLRVADNKIALNSAWDTEQLKIELTMSLEDGFKIADLGFEAGEVEMLLTKPHDPDFELLPPLVTRPVTKAGDIWLLGKHRLACGDARDADLLAKLMAGAQADAAFLDPPYNVPIDGYASGRGKHRHREFAHAAGEMSPEEFSRFLEGAFQSAAGVSRAGAVHFICMDHHHADQLMAAASTAYGSRLNICVWVKSNAGLGKLYRSQHELVFVYRIGHAQHRNNIQLGKYGRHRTNVWEYPSVNGFCRNRDQDLALHPTVKPVAMVADAICDVSEAGDIILDLFMGSGTSLIAAERCRRICYGMEIDPHYVEVALDRWANITAQQPVLEATGQTLVQLRAAGSAEAAP